MNDISMESLSDDEEMAWEMTTQPTNKKERERSVKKEKRVEEEIENKKSQEEDDDEEEMGWAVNRRKSQDKYIVETPAMEGGWKAASTSGLDGKNRPMEGSSAVSSLRIDRESDNDEGEVEEISSGRQTSTKRVPWVRRMFSRLNSMEEHENENDEKSSDEKQPSNVLGEKQPNNEDLSLQSIRDGGEESERSKSSKKEIDSSAARPWYKRLYSKLSSMQDEDTCSSVKEEKVDFDDSSDDAIKSFRSGGLGNDSPKGEKSAKEIDIIPDDGQKQVESSKQNKNFEAPIVESRENIVTRENDTSLPSGAQNGDETSKVNKKANEAVVMESLSADEGELEPDRSIDSNKKNNTEIFIERGVSGESSAPKELDLKVKTAFSENAQSDSSPDKVDSNDLVDTEERKFHGNGDDLPEPLRNALGDKADAVKFWSVPDPEEPVILGICCEPYRWCIFLPCFWPHALVCWCPLSYMGYVSKKFTLTKAVAVTDSSIEIVTQEHESCLIPGCCCIKPARVDSYPFDKHPVLTANSRHTGYLTYPFSSLRIKNREEDNFLDLYAHTNTEELQKAIDDSRDAFNSRTSKFEEPDPPSPKRRDVW